MLKRILLFTLLIFGLSGCAHQPGPSPSASAVNDFSGMRCSESVTPITGC